MTGTLYVAQNDALCAEFKDSATADPRGEEGTGVKTAPCYIAPNTTSKGLDYFSVDVLMRAAGKKGNNGLDTINYSDETYRETGGKERGRMGEGKVWATGAAVGRKWLLCAAPPPYCCSSLSMTPQFLPPPTTTTTTTTTLHLLQ